MTLPRVNLFRSLPTTVPCRSAAGLRVASRKLPICSSQAEDRCEPESVSWDIMVSPSSELEMAADLGVLQIWIRWNWVFVSASANSLANLPFLEIESPIQFYISGKR